MTIAFSTTSITQLSACTEQLSDELERQFICLILF